MSATLATRPRSTSWLTSTSPMPSIFMTPREAQCRMVSRSLAGQLALTQRWSASPSARTTRPPQTGQCVGMRKERWSRGCSTTRTTLGITSPPRSTSTTSPMWTSRRSISSMLCSVARLTVDVQALYLVHVVQRGAADGGAADGHGLKPGDRSQLPGPPDLRHDVFNLRHARTRCVFIGGGPARRLAGIAEALPQVGAIYLHHHAVNFVRKLIAPGLPLANKGEDLTGIARDAPVGIHFETGGAQRLQGL